MATIRTPLPVAPGLLLGKCGGAVRATRGLYGDVGEAERTLSGHGGSGRRLAFQAVDLPHQDEYGKSDNQKVDRRVKK
jgi:hypothetical protein